MTHLYGPKVHWIHEPISFGMLAELCQSKTFQPQINRIVELLYRQLITVSCNQQLTTESFAAPTRMKDYHPEAVISGTRIAHDNKAIVVNLARAGTFPSHICYDFLHNFLPPENVRQDHIFASRATDNSMNVIGTDLSAAKIGGDVINSTVFFPDPMGATGNTIVSALEHYKKNLKGPARRYIALHLIVTPEYLKKVITAHPDLEIYTFRVDRGLSSPDVLNSPYGKYWDQEKGLNEKGYIVPGGGGFGEIMNNSFV